MAAVSQIRRPVVCLALAGLLLVPVAGAQTPPASQKWPTSTLAAQRRNGEGLDSLDAAIRAFRFGNVNRLVVVSRGQLVVSERYERDYRMEFERYRNRDGYDTTSHQFNYQHPDWHPFHQGRDVHSLQSVTKSIAATMIGVAIGRGEIAGTDVPFLDFLGEYDLTRVDPRLRTATLGDLLTMRSGIEWHEQDRPLDSTNTTIQLEASRDWVQFTLNQPMDAAPGTKWAYNSGGSHLMSAIIRRATGLTIDRYAERYLFGPLGITDYHWKLTPTGLPDTEGGLYLEAEDLAKIGELYLRDGSWNGSRVLPEGWQARATAQRVERVNAANYGYGFQWWRVDRGDTAIWAGLGYGGQYLVVIPDRELVAVVNSWNVYGGRTANVLNALVDALLAVR